MDLVIVELNTGNNVPGIYLVWKFFELDLVDLLKPG
jgi:hypothetical protein